MKFLSPEPLETAPLLDPLESALLVCDARALCTTVLVVCETGACTQLVPPIVAIDDVWLPPMLSQNVVVDPPVLSHRVGCHNFLEYLPSVVALWLELADSILLVVGVGWSCCVCLES